jgi:DMSO/TMAO reductase YedYZ molybdopterin-dependent catalytic subunit
MSIPRDCHRLVLAALVVALASVPGCAGGAERPQDQTVEVREYQGERLDPIAKFEENSIKGPQRVDIGRYKLEIGGLVGAPASYTYEQVLSRPALSRITVIHCVEGWDVKILWEGVSIPALLEEAGVKSGAKTVIFRSADGYSTSLPLADVMKRDMLLAFRMNGLTLPAERGFPFQVVAEDKWGYKWAKWVTKIELSDKPGFRGYWESRGYNNNGDLKGPIYEIR